MTAPYYLDSFVTLYHGDCLERQGWTNADFLVTDPPYGMSYTGFGGRRGEPSRTRGRSSIAGDESTSIRDAALALWGSKPSLVFGRWNIDRPAGVSTRLIWDKVTHGMGDLRMPWGPTDEEIYVTGSGFVGKRSSNVLRFQTLMSADSRRPSHPTPKPIGLMEALVASTTGIVADPFAGSGSTLLAARNLGRRSIGVEVDEAYCELIAKRLESTPMSLLGDWASA